MPDFEKKVSLIEVEIDSKAAQKNVDLLTSSIFDQKEAIKENNDEIKTLNKTNKDLEKQVKAGTITEKEANKQIEANRKSVKQLDAINSGLKDGLKDLNAERNNSVKTTKLQSNSLDALRKKVVEQKKELNGLNTATEAGAKRFEELTAELKANNDKIVELDQSAGDFKTTIGRYKEAFSEAVGGINIFGTSLGGVFQMVKANPLMLLVTALAGLVAMFKNSQTGAEFFRKTGAAMNTVFGKLSDIIEMVGGKMVEAFENPKQAIIDLKNLIVDNIVKYFTEFIPNAIKNVIDGFELLADAIVDLDFDKAAEGASKLVDGLTDLNPITAAVKATVEAAVPAMANFAKEVNEATGSAYGLEQAMIANEKAMADQEVIVAQSIQRQKELNRIIEDQNLTFEKRIAAAEKFSETEDAQVKRSIQLAEERLSILKAQNDLTNSTEEDIQKVRDAEIELANLRAASDERQLTNANKLFGIKQQQAAEDEKLAAEAMAREGEMVQSSLALQEFRRSQANENRLKEIEDTKEYYALLQEVESENFNIDQERLAKEAEIIKENDALSEEERQTLLNENQLAVEELEAEHNARMQELRDKEVDDVKKAENEKAATRKKSTQSIDKFVTAATDGRTAYLQNKYNENLSNLQKQLDSGLISEEQFAKAKEDLDKQNAKKEYDLKKKQFLIDKGKSIVQIGVDTARAVAAAVAAAPLTGGLPFSAINAGLGAAQLAVVLAKKMPPPPTFAEGGGVTSHMVGGQRHSNGGTKYFGEDGNVFEAERGEGIFVTKREATAQALSAINEMHGGRSMFEHGGRFLENGGQAAQDADAGMMRQMISDIIGQTPAPVVDVRSIMGGLNAEKEAKEVGVI